ncbi:MAG: hypothetical protein SF162_07315 [bacterium]|nr:hypothetical protein [bacterium]
MKQRSLVFTSLFVFILSALLVSVGISFAQEATPDPALATVDPAADPAAQPEGGVDLEGLTADPDAYLGQTITLEGVVSNLLNVRAFVLGEGAALDDDQVLVINMTGEEFDIRVTDGTRFVVTGVVYPSFANGGFTQLVADMAASGLMQTDRATMEATAESGALAETTPEVGVAGGMMAYSTDLAQMIIPDNLFDHTIIAVSSIDQIQLINLPE